MSKCEHETIRNFDDEGVAVCPTCRERLSITDVSILFVERMDAKNVKIARLRDDIEILERQIDNGINDREKIKTELFQKETRISALEDVLRGAKDSIGSLSAENIKLHALLKARDRGKHDADCNINTEISTNPPHDCDCGYEALRAAGDMQWGCL